MRFKVSFVALAVMALASVSFAQQGGGQGGQGGGRQGGMRGMMQMGGGQRLTQLLRNPQVQAELKITDDQKAKIAELPGGRGGGRGPGGGGGGQRGPGQAPTPEEQLKQLTDDKAATAAILTPEQETRLEELRVQWAGPRAATLPDVQAALALSDDQKAKIADLMTKQGEANRGLFEKMRNQEIEPADFQSTMQKNNDILKTEIEKVLTADQNAKLKTMGGKELKMEAPQRRGGGRNG